MALFELALSCGVADPDRLAEEIPARTFAEWLVFRKLVGPLAMVCREDLTGARMVQAIAASAGARLDFNRCRLWEFPEIGAGHQGPVEVIDDEEAGARKRAEIYAKMRARFGGR